MVDKSSTSIQKREQLKSANREHKIGKRRYDLYFILNYCVRTLKVISIL